MESELILREDGEGGAFINGSMELDGYIHYVDVDFIFKTAVNKHGNTYKGVQVEEVMLGTVDLLPVFGAESFGVLEDVIEAAIKDQKEEEEADEDDVKKGPKHGYNESVEV